MAWTNFVLSLQNLFFGSFGTISILGIVILSGLGIYFFRKARKEPVEEKKKSLKKWGIVLLEAPWVLVVAYLAYWIIAQIVQFYKT